MIFSQIKSKYLFKAARFGVLIKYLSKNLGLLWICLDNQALWVANDIYQIQFIFKQKQHALFAC